MPKKQAMIKPRPKLPAMQPVKPPVKQPAVPLIKHPVALVKPPPEAAPSVDLATVLQQWGNDRAYTVIRQYGNTWKVLFEGDLQPCLVKVEHNKVVIIKD